MVLLYLRIVLLRLAGTYYFGMSMIPSQPSGGD